MPIKMVQEAKLREGEYFFAGDLTEGSSVLFCYVIDEKCTEATVINGAFNVKIEPDKKHIRIPYLRGRAPIPIRYIGKPDIENLTDYNAAIDWFLKIA